LKKKKDKKASLLYSFVLLTCDGYLSISAKEKKTNEQVRFFGMVTQLPLELQMIICNRAHYLMTDFITRDLMEDVRQILQYF